METTLASCLNLPDHFILRIIPAWAGNTADADGAPLGQSDHPRVGGEHSIYQGIYIYRCGSSPRARGTLLGPAQPMVYVSPGSSPRGRGTRFAPRPHAPQYRIIPAWAGNTRGIVGVAAVITDHPRVGGEHSVRGLLNDIKDGSSPRGRGTHAGRDFGRHRQRIIPAWAGNTSQVSALPRDQTDHPRVGGEHVHVVPGSVDSDGSSPRGRGTPGGAGVAHPYRRIIPAWAGNTYAGPRP